MVNQIGGVTMNAFGGTPVSQTNAALEASRSMAEVMRDVEQAFAINETTQVDTKPMDAATYKAYILERISELPIHSSQSQTSISVHISDEGFAAMQSDPDYEAWVLDTLKRDFGFNDPWSPICGGHYVVHTFGATKEEYRGQSWFPQYLDGQGTALYDSKSAGAVWRRDTDTATSSPSTNRYADYSAKLRLERLMRKLALQHNEEQSALLQQASEHRRLVEEFNRTGKQRSVSAPAPRLTGVPAAYLLAMLGGGGTMGLF